MRIEFGAKTYKVPFSAYEETLFKRMCRLKGMSQAELIRECAGPLFEVLERQPFEFEPDYPVNIADADKEKDLRPMRQSRALEEAAALDEQLSPGEYIKAIFQKEIRRCWPVHEIKQALRVAVLTAAASVKHEAGIPFLLTRMGLECSPQNDSLVRIPNELLPELWYDIEDSSIYFVGLDEDGELDLFELPSDY